MVRIGNLNLNITEELQQLLKDNPPQTVKKPVISKKKDDFGNLVQEKEADGSPKFENAINHTIPKVYFDAHGRYYLRAFRSKVVDGVEVLITNPNIETDSDCNLYGRGVISHRKVIPGSELWDNGSSTSMQHREAVSKGDPLTKIVKVMTRDEILAVSLKPQGESLIAKVSNSTEAEKDVLTKELTGLDRSTIDLLKNPEVLKRLKELSEE